MGPASIQGHLLLTGSVLGQISFEFLARFEDSKQLTEVIMVFVENSLFIFLQQQHCIVNI